MKKAKLRTSHGIALGITWLAVAVTAFLATLPHDDPVITLGTPTAMATYTPAPTNTPRAAETDTPTATALATSVARWYMPYASLIDRATPTQIRLGTSTPRPTATRFTGTSAATWTPYP